ncbi:hypothetical protein NONO_c60270 [Nocardia nova SH22a]|uniref:Uncharacterized protein n=1 Tax=Nocardia nova SH22a TaxID=1415166 RepID=W5TPD2_9NOCA|nr:hypothetical protein [Nocardia nova]AHH20803.1 hypothetical protein NONO_c60270 [Nocardia nova SH22a]
MIVRIDGVEIVGGETVEQFGSGFVDVKDADGRVLVTCHGVEKIEVTHDE